uniref:WGS project CBMI000000000 data, contig CS3069_c001501 n=1 Tax=Fusarium clavum TaxID=2594811 RepID=A0A090N5H7_9HYPO|nr:unnamed protein product [Fusarium clavum]CEG05777.1 unnamed protein product [Fusarium clavum]
MAELTSIKRRCFFVDIRMTKQDICGIGKRNATPEEVGKDTLTNYLPAELEYASIYWVYHLEASGRPNDMVYGFLLDHFLHWLEALSILKRLPHVLKVLQNLTDLVEVCSCSQMLYHSRLKTTAVL